MSGSLVVIPEEDEDAPGFPDPPHVAGEFAAAVVLPGLLVPCDERVELGDRAPLSAPGAVFLPDLHEVQGMSVRRPGLEPGAVSLEASRAVRCANDAG